MVGKITLLSEDSYVFSDDGESHQVAFEATLDWTASSSESFVIVEPKSGQAGEAAITVKVGENPEYEDRTATVTIKCGEDSKTVKVTQKLKGALLLTESLIPVAAEGGLVPVVAKATSNVTAAIDADAQSWITEVKTKVLLTITSSLKLQLMSQSSQEQERLCSQTKLIARQ